MRTILALALAVLTLLFAAGCGNKAREEAFPAAMDQGLLREPRGSRPVREGEPPPGREGVLAQPKPRDRGGAEGAFRQPRARPGAGAHGIRPAQDRYLGGCEEHGHPDPGGGGRSISETGAETPCFDLTWTVC